MTTKADYSREEWLQVVMTPLYTGFYMIFADRNFMGMLREIMTMGEAIQKVNPPGHARLLVRDIAADFKYMVAEKGYQNEIPQSIDHETAKQYILGKIEEGVNVVDRRARSMEVLAFKQWLVTVATEIAEAAKEGGFLDISGDYVSEKEKASLEDISNVLRL